MSLVAEFESSRRPYKMRLRTFAPKTRTKVHLVYSAVNNTSAGTHLKFVTECQVRNALYYFVGARSGGRSICGKGMLNNFEV
jgi:hypothetical protein